MKFRNLLKSFLPTWQHFILFLFIFGGLSLHHSAYASHAQGGDISVECLGGNMYQVTLSFYRDCEGIGEPGSAPILVSSASCGTSLNVTLNQSVPPVEVSQTCDSVTTACDNGPFPGTTVTEYSGVVTLPSDCNDWIFSYSVCCRNDAITNLLNPNAESIYIEALINNTNGLCNNSVQFSQSPVFFACANQLNTYNHGAFDVDGDSLVFTLVQPESAANTPIAYVPPFTVGQPMAVNNPGGFSFSSSTGTITFNPLPFVGGVPQFAVIAVLVEEFRNGVLVGSTIREMQIIIIQGAQCSSLDIGPPNVVFGSISTIDSSQLQVCAGDNLVFTFCGYDPDSSSVDSLTASTNIGLAIPGAVLQILPPFNPDSVCVVVGWNTDASDVGIYNFSVVFEDGACPISNVALVGFQIVVPGVFITAEDTVLCPGIAQSIPITSQGLSANGINAGTFSWSQLSGPPVVINNGTSPAPIIDVPNTTVDGEVIILEVVFDDGVCVTNDQVSIFMNSNADFTLDASVSDTSLCNNGTPQPIDLFANVTGGGVVASEALWTWTSTLGGVLDSTNTQNTTASPIGGTPIDYNVTFAYGACTDDTTITVEFDAATLDLVTDTATICFGDTAILTALYTSMAAQASGNCSTNPGPCNGLPTLYTIGTGVNSNPSTTTSATPFQGWWTEQRMQILYTATELQAQGLTSGLITDLAFDVVQKNSAQAFTGFTVSLSCVSNNDLPVSGFLASTPSVVFLGNISTINGWNTIIFDDGYEWDGVSNLLIEMCFDNGSSNFTASDPVNFTVTAANMMLYEFSDTQDGCALVGPPQGNTDRPNIRFTQCTLAPPFIYDWGPTNSVTHDTLDIAGASPLFSSWMYVSVTDGECPLVDSVFLNVITDLPAPVVNCGPATIGDVIFQWTAVPGATGHTISLDSGMTIIAANGPGGLSHTVSGLQSGECVTGFISSTGGPGICGNGVTPFTCCAVDCIDTSVDAIVPPSCNGFSDGTVAVSAINGTPSYAFTISTTPPTTLNAPNTVTFTGLAAGGYSISITDAMGCLEVIPAIVPVTSPITAQMSAIEETCLGNGEANASASGGTPPYSFVWSDPGAQTDSTATGLFAGSYTVTITDNNSCVFTSSVMVPFNGPSLNIQTPIPVICDGNSIDLGAYYTSTNPGDPCGLASSPNCNGPDSLITIGVGVNPSPTSLASETPFQNQFRGGRMQILYTASELMAAGVQAGLINQIEFDVVQINSPGLYQGFTVKVGCTALTDMNLPNFEPGLATTYMGNVTLTTGWNTIVFDTPYNWDGTSNLILETCFSNPAPAASDPVNFTSTVNTSILYSFADVIMGCIQDAPSVPLNTSSNRPNVRFTNCTNFTYNWEPAALVSDPSSWNVTVSPTVPTTFYVTVTDGICPLVDSIEITINSGFSAPGNLACNPTSDAIDFTWDPVVGATGYEVSLDGGTTWVPANGITGLSHLISGIGSNVSATIEVRVSNLGPIGCPNGIATLTCMSTSCSLVLVSSTEASCNGSSDGTLEVLGSGGPAPYSYQLTDLGGTVVGPQTSAVFTGLAAGSYSVTATDAPGDCIDVITVVINEPAAIDLASEVTNITCNGAGDGIINLTSTGGPAPITWLWSNSATTEDISGLLPGTYTVTATSGICTDVASFTITEPNEITISITADPVCNGFNDGVATASVTGGIAPLTYVWDNSQTDPTATGLLPGIYSVVVTDANLCTASESVTVEGVDPPVIDPWVSAIGVDTTTVFPGVDVPIDAGGNSPETGVVYTWSGDGNQYVIDPSASSTNANITPVSINGQPFEFILTADNGVCPPESGSVYIITEGSTVFFANTFTPGAEENRTFGPILDGAPDVMEFKIFNRWGQVVWDSPAGDSWDGRYNGIEQPRDVYVYYFVLKYPGEATETVIKGDVTLLR